MEENQPADNPYLSNNLLNNPHQNSQIPLEYPENFLPFLKEEEENPQSTPSFFSKNGLSRNILEVTDAEPDICLEVFYALSITFWPQIEKLNERKRLGNEETRLITSLQNAWRNFLGTSISKGILCSPEKLLEKKNAQEIKESLSKKGREAEVFQDLDNVVDFVKKLKQKIVDFPGQLIQKEEILTSLDRIEGVYTNFRERVIDLAQKSLQKNNDSMISYHALENLLEPKAVMMSDIFPNHWAYRIPRKKAHKMLSLDRGGSHVQNYSSEHSTHRVSALPEKDEASNPEPLVYFKANGRTAIQPEKEFMLYRLYQYLNIPVPETALLILTNVLPNNENYFYAVQASEAVTGSSALEGYQTQEINEEAYTSQVIGALLTNPSDGSFKNFKYSPRYKTLVGIDNDLIFKPEFIGDNDTTVNVKSVLFLSPLMDKSIPISLQTFLTTVDPHLTLLLWLHDLDRKNRGEMLLFSKLSYQHTRSLYQHLCPEDEQPSLAACIKEKIKIDSKLHQDSFYPQTLISKDMFNTLIEKLQKIESILSKNPSASSQDLFLEISPLLGKYYHKLRLEIQDPQTLQVALWGENINGVSYARLKPLFQSEELHSLAHNKNLLENDVSLYEPKEFFGDCKRALTPGQSPLDKLIKRHSQRKEENLFDLQLVQKELKLLMQEGFTELESPREAIDFLHDIPKIPSNIFLVQEIRSLISCSPSAELQWLFTVEQYFLRANENISNDLKASSVTVIGAFMKQRMFILTESEKRYLFDQLGNIKKNPSLTGRSNVTYFPEENPKFYLKQYPEFPGFEYASTLLMRLLGIKHLPYQDLVIIGKYPILITQNVEGFPVHTAWKDPQKFKNLDQFHTGLLIIATMLFNPEDGKEDNFILSPDGKYLISIDNDHCFLPTTFQKNGGFWKGYTVNTALQTKTLLFCLDEMSRVVPVEVRQQIREVDKLLIEWMEELTQIQNLYTNFVSAEQQNQFAENGTILKIPFYKQFIESIHWKVHKIQCLLTKKLDATPFDLLRAVEPFAARCYEHSFKYTTLKDRFKSVTEDLYPKSKHDEPRTSVLGTRKIMEIINISKEELKNIQQKDGYQVMEPAGALTYLKELIKDRDQKAKEEEDILCELDNKNEDKRFFNLFGKSILETALEEFFTNPKEGLALKGSKLITKRNLAPFLIMTPYTGTKIRFLSLPESPDFTHECIEVLAMGCPNLEYLNVNGCVKLKQLITKEGQWPLLVRIEARGCLNLKKLFSFSPIKILRIETHNEIEIFVEKPTLDIFMITLIANQLHFSVKKLEEFELKSPNQTLSSDNLIQCINSGYNIEQHFQKLKITLGAYSISTEWDLAIFITVINLNGSKLQVGALFTISRIKLMNLKRLGLSKAGITTDDLKHLIKGFWPKLNYLDLSGNQISDEGLTILSRGNWLELEIVNLEEASFTKRGLLNFLLCVNWPNCREIITIPSLQNFAQSLLPKNRDLLEELDLSSSNIDKTDIEVIVNQPQWKRLKYLNLSSNKIKEKDLEILVRGDWPRLEILILEEASFTKRGLLNFLLCVNWPNCREIITIPSLQNFTQSLLPKNRDLLEELDLSSNNIDKNDIEVIVNGPKLPRLKRLNLSSNQIKEKDLEILVRGDWDELEILDLSLTNMTLIGIEVLVRNSSWPNLKHLNLNGNNQINEKALESLSQGNWPLLDELSSNKTEVTKKGLINLIWKLNLPKLKKMMLGSDRKDFTASELLPSNRYLLEKLDLSSCQMTQNDIEIIVKRYDWPNLKHLNLSRNQIHGNGLETLAQGNWPSLETLNLQLTNVTMKVIEEIVNVSNWKNLKHINLVENEITDEALAILCRGNWPELETIDLGYIEVTNRVLLLSNCFLNANWPKFKGFTGHWKTFSSSKKNLIESLIRKDLSQLERLDLNDLKIISDKFETIIEKNEYKLPQLKFLKLLENDSSCESRISVLARTECPLLEELHLENTNIELEGVKKIISQSKFLKIKYLNISNNELFDEGLSVFTLTKFPSLEEFHIKNTKMTTKGIEILVNRMELLNLKKLDISENAIFDEGLETLVSGNWPLFEHLIYYETKVTLKGHITLLKNFQWKKLQNLEHSLSESFYNSDQIPSEMIKSNFRMYDKVSNQRVAVLKMNWLDSKEIHLSITGDDFHEKITLLTHEKWDQLEDLKLSFDGLEKIQQAQSIVCPRNLKSLDLSNNSLSDENSFESISFENCPLLENISLQNAHITTKWLKNLINKSDWTHLIATQGLGNLINSFKWSDLKTLNISLNPVQDGGLEILTSANWPLLENLNIRNTSITTQGMEVFRKNRSNLPNLKKVNVSQNPIEDEGLKIFVFSNYDLLEYLNLEETGIRDEGIKILGSKSNWPNLKELHISRNWIYDEGLVKLSSGKWPKLENLYLSKLKIIGYGIGSMVSQSKWPSLKILDLSDNKKIIRQHSLHLRALALGEWPLLECLNLNQVGIPPSDLEDLIKKSSWPLLKKIHLCSREFPHPVDKDRKTAEELIRTKWPSIKLTIGDD